MIKSAIGGVIGGGKGVGGSGANNTGGNASKPPLLARKRVVTASSAVVGGGGGVGIGENDRRKMVTKNGNFVGSIGCGHQLFAAKGGERCNSASSDSASELDSFAAVKPRFRAKEKLYVNIGDQCDENELQNWTTDEDYFNENIHRTTLDSSDNESIHCPNYSQHFGAFKTQSCSTLYSHPDASKRSSLCTAKRTVATANDNRIIIQIKYDEDKAKPPIPLRRNIDRRPKSLALSTVGSSDGNGVTRFSTYNVSEICDDGRRYPKQPPYNERPIDVPVDFEREAYARALKHNQSPLRRKITAPLRHLNPTLEDFLQEDWIKIDDDPKFNRSYLSNRSFDENRRHSTNDIAAMGAGCTKHLSKLGKHSVAPQTSEPTPQPRFQKPKSFDENNRRTTTNPFDEPVRIIRPAKSTNPFEEDDDDSTTLPHVPPPLKPITPAYSHCFAPPPPYASRHSSSTIDQNSILYRSREIHSAGKRNIIRAHIHSESVPQRLTHAESQRYLNEISVAATRTPDKRDSVNYNLYRRLGGSFQTLVTTRKSVRPISASETNLSKIRRCDDSNSPTKRFSVGGVYGGSPRGQVDYCPSVMFNRLNALRQKEKESAAKGSPRRAVTFSRWKSFWTDNFLRKRKDNQSRKT